MAGETQALKDRLNRERGAEAALLNQRKSLEQAKETEEENLQNLEKAREVLQIVAKNTQDNLQYHISGLVTTAQASIFPDPYEFVAEFVARRDKTECDLLFARGGDRFSPFSSCGGGPVDVASFALRLVAWSLNKTVPVIVLDEPFKFVSVDLQPRCSDLLKTLSARLGLQIIMISHLPNVIDSADRIFLVDKGTVTEKTP